MSAVPDARAAQVAELTKSALERDPREWTAFLRETCGGDLELRAEVESLLRYRGQARGLMKEPAAHLAAEMFSCDRELKAEETIGNYQIISLIGSGGMGDVYLAQEQKLNRKVALKIVRRGVDTETVLRRFQREEQILATLTHPNIARLYGGAITYEGLPYFVMEYVAGPRLDHYWRDHTDSSLTARLMLFQKICAAVSYAHQHLVIHRDLKPSNIRLTPEGEPKLLDFGIAKVLHSNDARLEGVTLTFPAAMTPEYASPEQVRGENMTTASDIYSLGVILYELLTGARPYRAASRTRHEISRAITDQEVVRPSVAAGRKALRGDLDNIVLMALRKEPARRYGTVAQFASDIERYLEGRPVGARKDTLGYRSAKFIRRNKLGVTAAALVVLSLVGGVVVARSEAHRAEAQRVKAEKRFNDVRRLANSFLFEVDPLIENLFGATAARETLVKRALEYLDSLAQEASDDHSLQYELAAAYFKVGNIQGRPFQPNLGNPGGAFVSFRKAQAIFEKLLASEPANPRVQSDLSYIYQQLGILVEEAGDLAGSLSYQEKAVAGFEGLAASNPANVEYALNLVRGYNYLGTAVLALAIAEESVSRHEQALQSHRRAIAIVESLEKSNPAEPELLRQVASAYLRIGYALRSLDELTGQVGNSSTALTYEQKAKIIFDDLSASEPTNIVYRRHTADARLSIGHSELIVGDAAAALEEFKTAIMTCEALAEADWRDMQARHDLADAYRGAAEAMAASPDSTGALAYAGKALKLYQALPINRPIFAAIVKTNEIMADLAVRVGDDEGAIASYRAALLALDRWIATEPGDKSAQRMQTCDRTKLVSLSAIDGRR